ncbi:MAG: DUF4321 domain-containing protein [Candidatus Rokubacteria bacterium]|nr:DUF4321 domain-containing protein [Candidatus Rokubacteria bacterium]
MGLPRGDERRRSATDLARRGRRRDRQAPEEAAALLGRRHAPALLRSPSLHSRRRGGRDPRRHRRGAADRHLSAVAASRGLGLIVLIVVAGLVVGSLLGELVASLLPSGVVHDLLTRGPQIGLTPPATLDLRFVALTFGMMLKVNVVGVLGVVLAALALRRL